MPAILDRFVSRLQKRHVPRERAYAIATSALQRSGYLKKGSQKLTKRGRNHRPRRR